MDINVEGKRGIISTKKWWIDRKENDTVIRKQLRWAEVKKYKNQ